MQTRLQRMFGRMGVRLWIPFVIGAFVAVAVVALLVITSVDTQRERTFAEQRDVANNLALQTSGYLARLQNNVQTVASIVSLPQSDRSTAERLLSNVQQSEPAYMELAVVGADGLDVARVTRPDVLNTGLQNHAADPAFQAALKGETTLGQVKPVNGFPAMWITVPVVSENGPVGAVTAQIDLTTLWELVSTAAAHGYTYLVDDHGTLVAYRELASAPSSVMNQPVVLDAVTSSAESATSRTYDTGLALPGEPVLAYYKPLPVGNGNWYAIVEEPTAEAFAQVNRFIVVGALLLIASVMAIILMGLYIARRVVRPVSILRQGAAQLAAGNFDQRIIGVTTGDELEFLAVEFNDMAGRLQTAQGAMAETAREREQQYEVAQRRVKEMSLLLEAGRAITSLDLANVLDNLARESAGAVGADRCAIYVFDEAQQVLKLRGWWDFEGLVRPALEYQLGEGVVGWAAYENKPLFLANAQADQRFIPKWYHDNDIAAVMSVPLTSDGAVVGVLQVATRPGTPAFSREDQRLLNSFAEQSAVAIKNAQLYEIERRRAQEMALVAEINRTISESLDLDMTLNSILASIRMLVPYDLAEINLWNENDQLLHTHGRGAVAQYDAYRRAPGRVYRLDEGITGWLARQRKPLLIGDLSTSETKSILDQQQFPVRAICAAPLLSGDQLVGTIELASFRPQAFTEGHLETLTTVAGQAAVAIQNAQLFAETRRRVGESATLFRISTIAASALSPDDLLRKLMGEIGTLLNAELGLAMLYNPNTQGLEPLLAASFGDVPDDVRDVRIDATAPAFQHSVFSTRTVFRSDDAMHDRRTAPFYRELVNRYQIRSLIAAPLVIHDRVIGEVYIARRAIAPFTVEDEQRLGTVLTLLADAIENFRMSAEQQRRLRQLNLLGEIGRAISAALREEDVYNMLYEQVNRVLDAHSLYIVTYDAAVDEVEFQRLYEEGELAVLPEEERKRRGDNSLTFYVCRNRTPLLLRGDVTAEAAKLGIAVRLVASGHPAQAWMGAPMIAGDRVIGMLAVQHLRDRYAYDENDLNLLQAIANQTGITVEHARLYQLTDVRLNERVEELTALSVIVRELNATLDRERIFNVVLTEALKVTGAAYGFISMIEPQSRTLDVLATQGLTPQEASLIAAQTIHVGEGITGRAALTEQSVLVNDVRLSADYVELRPGILSEIAVPVCYAQSVVGVLNLESPQADAFTEEHTNFLNALAEQAAIAIGNAQRLEEYKARGELLRRRAEQLTNLFQIGQAFRTDQPLDHVLDDVVHAIQETVGFNAVVLSLVEADLQRLRRVAAAGVPVAVFEEMKKVQQPWSLIQSVLQPQFLISQSYYVPMEQAQVADVLDTYTLPGGERSEQRKPGMWHADDVLITLLRGTGDRVLGLISVDDPVDGRVPDRPTIEALELFANQAAIAIENHALFDDLQQRLNNLMLFNEVGRSISAHLDLDSLLVTVLDAAGQLVGSEYAAIFLRDPVNHKFVPRQALGYDLQQISELRFGPDEGLISLIVADPRTIIIPNVDEEPRYVRHDGSGNLKSVILAPLSVAGSLIGVLTVDKPVINGFTDTDRVVLSTLADQAAVAIENARLFEAEREQRSLAETLRDLSVVLSSTLNVNEVLDTMLVQVARVVPYDGANIMLIDEPGGIARVIRSRGYDRISPGLSAALENLRFAVPEVDNLRYILETGRTMIIADTRAYAGWVDTPETHWVRSYLCAPLRIRDTVVGFFNLDSAVPGFFTSVHAERLLAFAAQSSVAIENAQLYEETQRRLQDQSLLYEAGQAIAATLAYDQVLETVTDQLVRATSAQIVLIQEWDRARDQVITVYQKYRTAEGLRDPALLERPFAPTDYLKVAQYLRDRRSISLRVQDDDLDPLLRARMQDVGLLWTVEVPIVVRDEVLGLARLGDTRFDRPLSDSEVQVIETLVNQAAVAMSNARLYEQVVKFTQELEGRVAERTRELAIANAELTQERDRVETLFRITSELSTSLDLDRVLNRALELVVNAAGAAHGSILLVDQQTDVLVARAVLGGDRIPVSGKPTQFHRGEGLAGWAIASRQAAIVDDVHSDPRWIEHSSQISQFRSGLVVPLSVSDEVLGAMLLLHPEPHYFNEVHMRLVSAASSQVATAINNAALYHYISDQAELLGTMLRAQQVESSKSQAILESVADGVMVSDSHGLVILFNVAAERILGIKRDEAIGRPIDDMLGLYSAAGPQWMARVREWHTSAESRHKTPVLSQRMEFKAEKRFVTVTVAPVTMSEEYLGSVSVFRDVTAEVEADRTKSEFVSTVSHELRTPMTSIKGYADLLLIGAAGPVNETQQRFLSVIKSNADRLSILVNDLLDISRIESGRVKLDMKPLSLEAAIETAVILLRPKIEEKNLTLRVQLPDGDLPRVYGDRDRVAQILTNLISNAYQYTPAGGTLTVRAHVMGDYVQLDVSDTGIGIAPENQTKVFDRFFRADDPLVQEFSGTGLGLSIVKSLVEMHEGRIWLDSQPGVGTTFSFTLRAVESLPEPEIVAEPPPAVVEPVRVAPAVEAAPAANGQRVPGLCVLVVEDDRDIAELIGRHLVSSGYQVNIASCAKDALKYARELAPDLITLDLYLPDADGFELLQQLKTDPATANIPVVIVSVMPDQQEGLRLGAVDYLTKPIDPLRLVSAVNRVLHGPGKVLVIDDDRDTRALLQVALEQRGFMVVLTASGKRALTLARQEQPDLILLDLKLPGLDGHEVLHRLKNTPETADIPVVIITGSLTDVELKQQNLLSLGAARFMTKPFAVDELVEEIGALVGKSAVQTVL